MYSNRIKNRTNSKLGQSETRTLNFLYYYRTYNVTQTVFAGTQTHAVLRRTYQKKLSSDPTCGVLKSLFIAKKIRINIIG